jgi:hypothetical protein
MFNHDEYVQQAKRGGDGDEEIARNEPLGVHAQERRPGRRRTKVSAAVARRCRKARAVSAIRSANRTQNDLERRNHGLMMPHRLCVGIHCSDRINGDDNGPRPMISKI